MRPARATKHPRAKPGEQEESAVDGVKSEGANQNAPGHEDHRSSRRLGCLFSFSAAQPGQGAAGLHPLGGPNFVTPAVTPNAIGVAAFLSKCLKKMVLRDRIEITMQNHKD